MRRLASALRERLSRRALYQCHDGRLWSTSHLVLVCAGPSISPWRSDYGGVGFAAGSTMPTLSLTALEDQRDMQDGRVQVLVLSSRDYLLSRNDQFKTTEAGVTVTDDDHTSELESTSARTEPTTPTWTRETP